MANLAGQGLGWVPTAGNVITGACYLGCLALSSKLDQSLDAAIVVLAPILLLLNQVRPGFMHAHPVAAQSGGTRETGCLSCCCWIRCSLKFCLLIQGGHMCFGGLHAGTGTNWALLTWCSVLRTLGP